MTGICLDRGPVSSEGALSACVREYGHLGTCHFMPESEIKVTLTEARHMMVERMNFIEDLINGLKVRQPLLCRVLVDNVKVEDREWSSAYKASADVFIDKLELLQKPFIGTAWVPKLAEELLTNAFRQATKHLLPLLVERLTQEAIRAGLKPTRSPEYKPTSELLRGMRKPL